MRQHGSSSLSNSTPAVRFAGEVRKLQAVVTYSAVVILCAGWIFREALLFCKHLGNRCTRTGQLGSRASVPVLSAVGEVFWYALGINRGHRRRVGKMEIGKCWEIGRQARFLHVCVCVCACVCTVRCEVV